MRGVCNKRNMYEILSAMLSLFNEFMKTLGSIHLRKVGEPTGWNKSYLKERIIL